MTFSPGTRLGQYEVVGLLGAGGMGEVYHGVTITPGSRLGPYETTARRTRAVVLRAVRREGSPLSE